MVKRHKRNRYVEGCVCLIKRFCRVSFNSCGNVKWIMRRTFLILSKDVDGVKDVFVRGFMIKFYYI